MSELRSLARGVPGAEWRRINSIPPSSGPTPIRIPVPGKCAWAIQSVSAQFSASADEGVRFPTLVLLDAENAPLWSIGVPTALAPDDVRSVSWSTGLGTAITAPALSVSLPLPAPAYAFPGEKLFILGMTDDTDTISAIRVVVIETYTGDEIHEANAEQQIVDHWHALYELYRDRRV